MKRLTAIAFLILSLDVWAQQLPLSGQYVINPAFLSPAFNGHNTNYEAFLGYQRSWLGVQGAPELKLFTLNGPIGESMGLGGAVIDDQVGIFRSLQMQVSYAYHLQVQDHSTLSFGAQAGMIDQQIRVTQSTTYDPALALVQGNQKKHFNLGVGINYRWKHLDAGIVLPYLLENATTVGDTSQSAYVQARHYRMYARYLIDLTPDIALTPVAVLSSTLNSTHFDANVLVNYKDFAWLGLGYNSGNTFNLHVGGLPLAWLSMQYSFGVGGSGILAESAGSHEFTLGILIGADESTSTSIFRRKPGEKQKEYYKWLDR